MPQKQRKPLPQVPQEQADEDVEIVNVTGEEHVDYSQYNNQDQLNPDDVEIVDVEERHDTETTDSVPEGQMYHLEQGMQQMQFEQQQQQQNQQQQQQMLLAQQQQQQQQQMLLAQQQQQQQQMLLAQQQQQAMLAQQQQEEMMMEMEMSMGMGMGMIAPGYGMHPPPGPGPFGPMGYGM